MEAMSMRRMARIKKSLTLLIVIALIWLSAIQTDFSLSTLAAGLPKMNLLINEMFPPDWAYFGSITEPMLDTVRMALLGTTFGAITAVPVALLAARNVARIPVVYQIARFIMNLIRTIPELLLAALFVPIFGIGEVSGILAISVFSFGIIAKLLYESIEAIDPGPLEAMTAVGANKLQWIFYGVAPQVVAHFISYTLYSFEINVRAAAVLGYVGAGGIGLISYNALSFYQYDRVLTIILYTFLVVLLIDLISNRIREKLI